MLLVWNVLIRRWKSVNSILTFYRSVVVLTLFHKRSHFKFCQKLLHIEISSNHKKSKELWKQQQESQNLVKNVATSMKQTFITYIINCVVLKQVFEVKSRDARKQNYPLIKSNAENDLQSNPNNVIWNLSSRNLIKKSNTYYKS